MQLDQTRVVIRERQLSETLDLSLRLLRHALGPLVLLTLPTAILILLLNYFLVGSLAPLNPADYEYGELYEMHFRYIWNLGALLAVEAPLVTLFVSSYLGHLVFEDQPSVRKSIRETCAMWPKLLWCLGVRRLILPAIVLALFMDSYQVNAAEIWLSIVALVTLVVRAARPYLLEIILLERNPLRKSSKNAITIGRRNATLHNPNTSELVGRWMVAALVGVILIGSLFGTLLFVQGFYFNAWTVGPAMLLLGLPMTVMFVMLYLTVFRFLSYLNLRIRQEGWEVELLLRAEAARMRGELSGSW